MYFSNTESGFLWRVGSGHSLLGFETPKKTGTYPEEGHDDKILLVPVDEEVGQGQGLAAPLLPVQDVSANRFFCLATRRIF